MDLGLTRAVCHPMESPPVTRASGIGFLCSERASFVNGANYRFDAGSVATI